MSALMVMTATSTLAEARQLAQRLLHARIAACINLIPDMESHYRWKGKKQKNRETLLLVKTRASLFPKVDRLIRRHHPYSVPEVLAFSVSRGSRSYLDWLLAETQD